MKVTTRASDYALLLLIHLAHLPAKETSSIRKTAQKLNLSLRFLANIANKLSIARLVSSHRGVGGGIRLARPPKNISIREVIEAVDGPIQTMFCQNTLELCTHEDLCQMKHFWDDVQNTVVAKLHNTTIEDLIGRKKLGSGDQSVKNLFPGETTFV